MTPTSNHRKQVAISLLRRAGFESNVSVYEAIGALRICEHDLLRMLDLRSDNDTGEQLPDVMDEG